MRTAFRCAVLAIALTSCAHASQEKPYYDNSEVVTAIWVRKDVFFVPSRKPGCYTKRVTWSAWLNQDQLIEDTANQPTPTPIPFQSVTGEPSAGAAVEALLKKTGAP